MDKMRAQMVAIETLRRIAEQMDLKGFGGVLAFREGETIWNPALVVVDDFQRGRKPDGDENDHGANYAAVSFSKFAEMMETRANSGTTKDRPPKKGEFGYRGGVILEEGEIIMFAFFSGGSEDEDVAVASAAILTLRDALKAFSQI